MIRISRGNVASKRRKKYLKLAKGYRGSNSRLSTYASEQVIQSFNFAYIGRLQNNNYSRFIGSLKKLNILLNKQMLSSIAFNNLNLFNFLENKSRN